MIQKKRYHFKDMKKTYKGVRKKKFKKVNFDDFMIFLGLSIMKSPVILF